MTLAEQIVDALLEGWFRDRIEDIKDLTGIGSDSMGLGKNTEKGWKPKYKSQIGSYKPNQPSRRPRPTQEPGERTWEVG